MLSGKVVDFFDLVSFFSLQKPKLNANWTAKTTNDALLGPTWRTDSIRSRIMVQGNVQSWCFHFLSKEEVFISFSFWFILMQITEGHQHGTPTFYRNPPEQRLTNFQPFDLEKWWYVFEMFHFFFYFSSRLVKICCKIREFFWTF